VNLSFPEVNYLVRLFEFHVIFDVLFFRNFVSCLDERTMMANNVNEKKSDDK
jgi:hypothetical protein